MEARHFNPGVPVYVHRSFIGHGRKWERGREYTWREDGVPVEKVEQLWRSRFVVHKPGAIKAALAEDDGNDGLEDMTMRELRAICKDEGVTAARSRVDTIAAIREARR